MDEAQAVMLFHTSSHAVRAERVLKEEGIACRLVPVPRHLSSDCGVCLRVPRAVQEAARRSVEAARVEIVGVYDT